MSGCVSIPERVDLGAVSRDPASFEVVDKRPAANLVSRTEKTAYSDTYHLGDDAFSPSRMSLVMSRLQEKLAEPLRGKRIDIEALDVWVYHSRSPVQAPAYVPSSGNIGADLIGGMLAMYLVGKLNEDAEVQIRCIIKGKLGDREFDISEHETAARSDVHDGVKRAVLRAADAVVIELEKLLALREARVDAGT